MNTTTTGFRRHTLLMAICLGAASLASASDEHAGHQHSMHTVSIAVPAPDMQDPHAHHRQAMSAVGYQRAEARYPLPSLQLTDQDGKTVSIATLFDTDQPMAVNFIFTSCTTICPIMSATFAQAQRQLGVEADQIRWISISIDPEYDTPRRLSAYARRFDAGANWTFLTGNIDNIIDLQKAFAVYRGDKMNHAPTTFLRNGRDQPWVRLGGLTSSAELVHEYRQLADNR